MFSVPAEEHKHLWSSKSLKHYDDAFNLHLCDDVILDVFTFGNRLELSKVEIEGVLFERLIGMRFSKAPYLVFDMRSTETANDERSVNEKVV